MGEYVQVSTAVGDRETGAELARSAVEARLAASAQVCGPVLSAYWHLDEFGQGEEWRVLFKTTVARYPELEAHLLAHHPWSNPEVVALPLVSGASAYLDWVDRVTATDA
jgi:periplasmic divalent cation tolerance protein